MKNIVKKLLKMLKLKQLQEIMKEKFIFLTCY